MKRKVGMEGRPRSQVYTGHWTAALPQFDHHQTSKSELTPPHPLRAALSLDWPLKHGLTATRQRQIR